MSPPSKLKRNLNVRRRCVCPARGEWDMLVAKVPWSQDHYCDEKTSLNSEETIRPVYKTRVIHGTRGCGQEVLSRPASALLCVSLSSGAAPPPPNTPTLPTPLPHLQSIPCLFRFGPASLCFQNDGRARALCWTLCKRWGRGGGESLLVPLL